MSKKIYSIFVIFYTIFTIGILMGFNDHKNEINKERYVEENSKNISNINSSENEITKDDENKNNKLTQNNCEDNYEDQVSIKEINKGLKESTYENDKELNNYSNINYERSSQNRNHYTKVFKLTADEIISDLKPLEKAKILWVCRKLSKEEYSEIEEYLSYNNEKLGVTKVYEILENKLDEESIEEVKIIFSKYMDIEKVKEIFY